MDGSRAAPRPQCLEGARKKFESSERYWLFEGREVSLLDAVHHYLTYLEQANRPVPVCGLFEEFLSIKRQDNVSSKYLADLRSKLGRFVTSLSAISLPPKLNVGFAASTLALSLASRIGAM